MSESAALTELESATHVWIAHPDIVPSTQLAEQYLPLLNQEEQERYRRFHFDPDRHTYLAAHALVRISLSRYAPCRPEQWRFTVGTKGKPEIEPVAGTPPLRFNLSHTKGMVACVVTLDHECGVDVECVRSMKDMVGVADAVFSKAEVAYLNAQDSTDWPKNFFTLWTLKEAYIKAIGQGLSAPLRNITFDISTRPIYVKFHTEHLNDTGWLFQHWQPTASHHLAVATHSPFKPCQILYHELNLSDNHKNSFQRTCADFRLHAAMYV